jgi:hypothetical protein
VGYRAPQKRRAKDDVAQRSPKGRVFGKTWRKCPLCNSGIKDRDARRQLFLRGGRGYLAGSSGRPQSWRLKSISRGFFWATGSEWLDIEEGSASFETKGETSKAQPLGNNKDDCGTSGPARTLSGNRPGRAALRREQREDWESHRRENRATGKEGETDHRRHLHSPRKSRNDGMPVGYSGQTALRIGAMWHVEPSLGNDHEICYSCY